MRAVVVAQGRRTLAHWRQVAVSAALLLSLGYDCFAGFRLSARRLGVARFAMRTTKKTADPKAGRSTAPCFFCF
jgi:hypothetical protein